MFQWSEFLIFFSGLGQKVKDVDFIKSMSFWAQRGYQKLGGLPWLTVVTLARLGALELWLREVGDAESKSRTGPCPPGDLRGTGSDMGAGFSSPIDMMLIKLASCNLNVTLITLGAKLWAVKFGKFVEFAYLRCSKRLIFQCFVGGWVVLCLLH